MILKSILKCKFKMRSTLAILLLSMMLFAKKGLADVGKSGWPIFKKAQTANSRGIVSSFGPDASLGGMFYNPAMLGTMDTPQAYFFSEAGMVGDTMGGLLYSHPLKNGTIAGGLVGYDAGSIELNWIDSGQLVTQNAAAERDLMGAVGYGRRVAGNLYAGATVKAATTELAERNSANAFAADFGATYLMPKGFMFSAALQNLGTSTKFIDQANPLPTSTYLGAGYAAKFKNYSLLTGVGATYNMVDQTMMPEVGTELRYQFISMNIGYRFADEQTLTLGLGVRFKNIEVGYAYVPGIYLGTTHRMNITYKFNTPFTKKAKDKVAVQPVVVTPTKMVATSVPVKPKTTAAAAAKTMPAVKTAPAKSSAATKTTPTTTTSRATVSTTPSSQVLKAGLHNVAAQAAKKTDPATKETTKTTAKTPSEDQEG